MNHALTFNSLLAPVPLSTVFSRYLYTSACLHITGMFYIHCDLFLLSLIFVILVIVIIFFIMILEFYLQNWTTYLCTVPWQN
jgi:hypothetical protein